MKKIFKISETNQNFDSIKNKLNLDNLIFSKLASPYEKIGFRKDNNSLFFQLYAENNEHKERNPGDVYVKNILDYEEFSEDLNDWENIQEIKVKEKYENYTINSSEIFSYNSIPFFIRINFLKYDENWDNAEEKEMNFIVEPNNWVF